MFVSVFFWRNWRFFQSCERTKSPKCSFQFSTWFPRCERRRAPPYFCSSPCLEHLRPPSPPLPRGACGVAFSGWESWDLLGCCDLSSCWVDDKCAGLLLLPKNNLIYVLTFLEKFIVVWFKKIEISPTYLLQHICIPQTKIYSLLQHWIWCASRGRMFDNFSFKKQLSFLAYLCHDQKLLPNIEPCDFFTWNARGKERVDVQTLVICSFGFDLFEPIKSGGQW